MEGVRSATPDLKVAVLMESGELAAGLHVARQQDLSALVEREPPSIK
jgi:hypothetical protein